MDGASAADPARRPHTNGSSTVRRRFWRCLPPSGGLAPCPPAVLPPPAGRRFDEELLDELLQPLAAVSAEAELATGSPALRRAHRDAPLVLVGADALSGGAVRALPRRAGVVVVSTRELPAAEWAGAVELGAERVAVLPDDESWLLARSAAAVPVAGAARLARRRRRRRCGGAGASTVATALALTAAPSAVLVDADTWGAGLDLLLGAERVGLRWPELTGLRGRVGGDALRRAPRSTGCTSSPRRGPPRSRCRTRR